MSFLRAGMMRSFHTDLTPAGSEQMMFFRSSPEDDRGLDAALAVAVSTSLAIIFYK